MITKEMIRKYLIGIGADSSDSNVDEMYSILYGLVGLEHNSIEDARKALSIKMDEITNKIFWRPDQATSIIKENYGFLMTEKPQ